MTQNNYDPDYAGPFFTEQQLAQRWGRHIKTIQRYRRHNTGPTYYRVQQLAFGPRICTIRYRLHDVLAFELQHGIFPDLHSKKNG